MSAEKLEKALEAIRDEIKSTREDINQKLDESNTKLDKWKLDLEVSVQKQAKKCNLKHESSNARINALEVTSNDLIETNSRICKLRVNGLPENVNESSERVAERIKNLLGFAPNEIKTNSYCLKSGRAAGTMILEFANVIDKNKFFSAYLQSAKVLLIAKVMPTADKTLLNNRVYISHDLCRSQYEINKKATEMKKKGEILQSKILNGYVNVKFEEKGFFVRILSIDELMQQSQEAGKRKQAQSKSNQTNKNPTQNPKTQNKN